MEKLQLKYSSIDVEKLVNNIKNSKLGNELINKYSLTDNQILENYEMITNYISYNKQCENCKGMNYCNASTKGHIYGIKKDEIGYLTDYFTICDYYKDYYQRKNNLVYSTFNEDELLDGKQKRFMLDNPAILGIDNIKKIINIQSNKYCSGCYIQVSNTKVRLQLIKSLAYNLLPNHEVCIVKLSDALKAIKSDFNFKDGQNTFKTMHDSEILIIDGLGSEAITAWSRDEILLSLLDNRLQSDKVTILCSEFSIEDLKKLYRLGYNDDVKVNQLIQKIKDVNS